MVFFITSEVELLPPFFNDHEYFLFCKLFILHPFSIELLVYFLLNYRICFVFLDSSFIGYIIFPICDLEPEICLSEENVSLCLGPSILLVEE